MEEVALHNDLIQVSKSKATQVNHTLNASFYDADIAPLAGAIGEVLGESCRS